MKKVILFPFALFNPKTGGITCALFLLICTVFFQQSMAQSYVIDGNTYTPCGTSETVTAPFTSTVGSATTNSYFGKVLITVSGLGMARGTTYYTDAFYHFIGFSPEHNNQIWQLVTTIQDFVEQNHNDDAYLHIVYDVTAGMAVTPPYTPALRDDHTYSFIIDMTTLVPYPAASTTLRFGLNDGTYSDNSGEYTVNVTQLCCPGGGVGSLFFRDLDNDGYGHTSIRKHACSQPTGYVADNTDCNDDPAQGGASVYPGAPEICDGIDNNCNGQTDEGVKTTFYQDADKDGYGDPGNSTQSCSQPADYVTNNNDCNDNDAAINPATVWILDNDNDGYYPGVPIVQCTSPGAGYLIKATQQAGDCNDNDAAINPNTVWIKDADKDGYYSASLTQCVQPGGYVLKTTQQPGDCNDAKAGIHPGVPEKCDGLDNNCNGQIDEGVKITFYRDKDCDGYGDAAYSIKACCAPKGYVANSRDCNDGNKYIHPGAIGKCDGKDNDCDGKIDEGCSKLTLSGERTKEGNSGQKTLRFTVKLNVKSLQTVKVNYATQNGTANAGSDYIARSGTLTFNPGVKEKSVDITIKGDNSKEADETFYVKLSSPVNAVIAGNSGTGTIINDDGQRLSRSFDEEMLALEDVQDNGLQKIELYPNPNKGQFKVALHLSKHINATAKIELVNLMGQTVSSENGNVANGTLQKSIFMASSLPRGMYTVRIRVKERTYFSKLLYEK